VREDSYITVPIEPTAAMIDAGLGVSKGNRHTREKMRLRYKAMCAVAPPVEVEVVVPHHEFRFPHSEASEHAWVSMGTLFESAREDLGEETAFSVLLSRLTREMRRYIGSEAAAEVLRGMAATMGQAARYDQ